MKPSTEEQLQRQKDALIATTRALAKDHNIQITFDDVPSGQSDLALTLPEKIGESPELTRTRARADNYALTKRYHNPQIHSDYRPKERIKAQLFDALEQIRIETYGSQHLHGVAHNLSEKLNTRLKELK